MNTELKSFFDSLTKIEGLDVMYKRTRLVMRTTVTAFGRVFEDVLTSYHIHTSQRFPAAFFVYENFRAAVLNGKKFPVETERKLFEILSAAEKYDREHKNINFVW